MKKVNLTVFVVACLAFCLNAQTTKSVSLKKSLTDKEQVHAAVKDYVLGLYEVDTNRIKRSVHPTLWKRGYYMPPDKKGYKGPFEMTFEQLVSLTAKWNKDGNRANEKSPQTVEVFEVLDKIATAKVTAEWGIDYFHLAKEDDKWYIMNILWQSTPPFLGLANKEEVKKEKEKKKEKMKAKKKETKGK